MAPKRMKSAVPPPTKTEHAEIVLFRSPKEDWGVFSTWYTESDGCFSVDGNNFQSIEQFMQAGKASLFGDNELFQRILNSSGPKESKDLGTKVCSFVDSTWQSAWPSLLETATYAKFSQNAKLKRILLSTGSRRIGFANGKVGNWGIGIDIDDVNAFDPQKWSENRVGEALMHTRTRIATEKDTAVDVSCRSSRIMVEASECLSNESRVEFKEPRLSSVSIRVVDMAGEDVLGPVQVAGSGTVSDILAQVLAITRPGIDSRAKLIHGTCMLEDASNLANLQHDDELRLFVIYLAPLRKEDLTITHDNGMHGRCYGRSCYTIRHEPTKSTLELSSNYSMSSSYGRYHDYRDVELCQTDDGLGVEYIRRDFWDMPDPEDAGIEDESEIQEYYDRHKDHSVKFRVKLDLVDEKGLVWGPCVFKETIRE